MANIKQTITSDSAQYQRDMLKMQQQVTQLTEKLKKAKTESKGASQEQSGMLSAGVGQLAKMAAGWMSVTAAASIATKQVQDYYEMQRKAGKVQVDTANARMNLLRASIGLSKEEKSQLEAGIQSAQKSSGLSEGALAMTASEMVSSRGSSSIADVAEALKLAAQTGFDKPEIMNQIATGLLATGRARKSGDAEANMGYMLQMAEQARTTNIGMVATNLIPGVTALTGSGFDENQSAALLSALTLMTEDAEGRRSATAATMFAGRMRSFMKENFPQVQGASDQIEFLRSNPQVSAVFSEQLLDLGEAKYRQAISDFVGSPDSQVSRLYAENLAKMSGAGTFKPATDKLLNEIANDPLQQNAKLARQIEGMTERGWLSDLQRGKSGVIEERLDELLQSAGVGGVDRWRSQWNYRLNSSEPVQALQEELQRALEREETYFVGGAGDEGKAMIKEFIAAVKAFREASEQLKGKKAPTTAIPKAQ